MNAVIFCDGSCGWLAPLSRLPKALLPVCGRPLLAYLLDLLAESGCVEQALIVEEGRELSRGFGTVYRDLPLAYAHTAPDRAGTDTLVITEPVLADFDLGAALSAHQSRGGMTALCVSVTEPEMYPLLGDNQAFTGCGILSAGMPLRRELYALALGEQAWIYPDAGMWHRVGSVREYLRAQRAVLRSGLVAGGIRLESGSITPEGREDTRLLPPCCTEEGLQTGTDNRIRGCVLGRNVTIGSGAELEDCVIGDGAYIGDNVVCREAWIGAGAMLMRGSCMEPGSALGENARLGEASVLRQGVRVYRDRRVPPRTDAADDVRSSLPVPLELDSGSLCGEMTPLGLLRLGAGLAACGDTAVGCAGDPDSRALVHMLCAGIALAGGGCLRLEDCTLPQLQAASVMGDCALLLYADAGSRDCLELYSRGGLPLTRRQEQQIGSALLAPYAGSFRKDRCGMVAEGSGLAALYARQLALRGRVPCGRSIEVSAGSEGLRRLAGSLTGGSGASLVFQLSQRGRRLTVYGEDTGFIHYEQLLLLCCMGCGMRGEDAALPDWFPAAGDRLMKRYERRILRYGTQEGEARDLAIKQRFSLDGLELGVTLMELLADTGEPLARLLKQLPPLFTTRRLFCAGDGARRLLQQVCGNPRGGVLQEAPEGTVRVRPEGRESLLLYAASADMETACELCTQAERYLKTAVQQQKPAQL